MTNIPQPSPPIPIVEAVVEPQDITLCYEEEIEEDSESLSPSTSTYHPQSAVIKEESLGSSSNDRNPY